MHYLKTILILFFLPLVLNATPVTEEVWLSKTVFESNTQIFATVSSSEGLWQVQLFKKQPNQFQEQLWQKSFSSYANATAHLKSLMSSQGLKLFKSSSAEATAFQLNNEGFTTEVADEVLWHDSQVWTWEWELKFSEWVKVNVQKDFMTKINLETDCADLVFSVRWIFARINGLPAANSLAGTGQLFTNRSMKSAWKKLPTDPDWRKDQRFFAAVKYLISNTYTHTLFKDSYPIEINAETFLAGVYHVSLFGTTGHTLLVYSANEKNEVPIRVFYSNVPKIVRDLYEGIYFYAEQPKKEIAGFLRMRWPVFLNNEQAQLISKSKMPYFSEEQYSAEFIKIEKNFSIAVF